MAIIRILVEPGVWDIARICRRHRWASLPCVEEDRVNDPEPCPTCEALADERSLERFIEHRDAGRLNGVTE
jgi:hypothetical protein